MTRSPDGSRADRPDDGASRAGEPSPADAWRRAQEGFRRRRATWTRVGLGLGLLAIGGAGAYAIGHRMLPTAPRQAPPPGRGPRADESWSEVPVAVPLTLVAFAGLGFLVAALRRYEKGE